jgi:hypothetical protein
MDGYISNKKHIFCGWSRKILLAKVTCNTSQEDIKAEAKYRWSLQEKLDLQDREEINLIATHPRQIVPQDRQSIDVSKREIKFNIDGVTSAFKSTTIQGMYHDQC